MHAQMALLHSSSVNPLTAVPVAVGSVMVKWNGMRQLHMGVCRSYMSVCYGNQMRIALQCVLSVGRTHWAPFPG